MKPIFFSKIFFGENVAQEPAQLLAETWCPYLLWVLRNLPHKFEKLAHVTKSAKKKRHHMGNLAPLVPQKYALFEPQHGTYLCCSFLSLSCNTLYYASCFLRCCLCRYQILQKATVSLRFSFSNCFD